jgi:hypothetical protein
VQFFCVVEPTCDHRSNMPKSSPSRTYAGRISVAAAARAVLRGDLDKVGLSTVLTILEMERRTGLLVVKHGRQTVRIEVRGGHVVRARGEGPRQPAGADAVYLALGWPGGQFQLFDVRVHTGRDEIGLRTAFLLMEGMRRLDEARGAAVDASSGAGPAGTDGSDGLVNCL